jgi:hypothetical protein
MTDVGEMVERLRRKCVHTHPADAETMIEAADALERLTKTSEADVERVARAIYEHWEFGRREPGEKTKWVECGNSIMQQLARSFASAALEAMKGGAT